MSAIITSITTQGDVFEKMSELVFPLFEKYAKLHEYDFKPNYLSGPFERPVSWYKIPWLIELLENYETVLCLDVDCVIVDGKEDVLEGTSEIQNLVFLNTKEGEVPNCGIWILRKGMVDVLKAMWEMTDLLNHRWWENAALLRMMGYNMTKPSLCGCLIVNELRESTGRLDKKWNTLPGDPRKNACIRHAAGHDNKLDLIKLWCEEAQW